MSSHIVKLDWGTALQVLCSIASLPKCLSILWGSMCSLARLMSCQGFLRSSSIVCMIWRAVDAAALCVCRDRRSVMWNRTFSQECFGTLYDNYHASNQLRQVLERTSCKRLVIGHTPQVPA